MERHIELSKEEKMIFSLLKATLYNRFNENELQYFANTTEKEWIKCLNLSQEFGVLSLVCYGITQLPNIELMPPRAIKMQCIKKLYKAENTHKEYCKTIVKLQNIFKEHGIGMMVMKGVGISAYYPIPYLRRCGDIDIYTFSLDTSIMSNEEAIEKSDKVIRDLGIKVNTERLKHSSFYFDGIEIENHKYFVNVNILEEAKEVNNLLKKSTNPQKVTFYDEFEINIPSPEFNAVFIAFHASQHLGDVLSVYQIFDWVCILKKYGMIIPKEIKGIGFLKFIDCITSISNNLFGTNVPVKREMELENFVLNDILRYPFKSSNEPKNPFGWFAYKIKMNLYKQKMTGIFYNDNIFKALKRTTIFHYRKYFKKDKIWDSFKS